MTEVFAQRVVPAPVAEAVRVLRAPDSWLDEAVRSAGETGQAVDATLRGEVGRGRTRVRVSKRARVHLGRVERVRDRFVAPLTWEASGLAGLFPVMDAMIEVHPAGRGRTRLVFWGRYDPPLGRTGDLIDRMIAHRTAEATIEQLLTSLAAHLTGPSAATAAS